MYYLIILIVLILFVIYNDTEHFTGFRKSGCMTEFENDLDLFPFIPIQRKRRCSNRSHFPIRCFN
jgi:hypothetical protein